MARNPLRDRKKLSSNAPRVGTGEPGAEAATRRVEGARAAAAADADGPDLLGSVVEGAGGIRCRWCGRRQWWAGTGRDFDGTGHGRVDADGVGPRLGGTCGI